MGISVATVAGVLADDVACGALRAGDDGSDLLIGRLSGAQRLVEAQ
jgi:hypothetical protein